MPIRDPDPIDVDTTPGRPASADREPTQNPHDSSDRRTMHGAHAANTPGLARGDHGADAQAVSQHDDGAVSPSARRRLTHLFAFRLNRSQIIVGVLCAALGFALVTQVQQAQSDSLSGLRQEDLVRILDETTTRGNQLDSDLQALQNQRDTLTSASDKERAARDAAEQRATMQGILAGTLPVEGPGIVMTIEAGTRPIPAAALYNVLEELRNADAESVALNGIRITASSSFVDSSNGIVADGQTIEAPFVWTAIGDPHTLSVALSIPGGAIAQFAPYGSHPTVAERDRVAISAVKQITEPEYAKPDNTAPSTSSTG